MANNQNCESSRSEVPNPHKLIWCNQCFTFTNVEHLKSLLLANPLRPQCPGCSTLWSQAYMHRTFDAEFMTIAYPMAVKRAEVYTILKQESPSLSAQGKFTWCNQCGEFMELERMKAFVLANPLHPRCYGCSTYWPRLYMYRLFGAEFMNNAFQIAVKREAFRKYRRRMPAVSYRQSVAFFTHIQPRQVNNAHSQTGLFADQIAYLQEDCINIMKKYAFAEIDDELVQALCTITDLLPTIDNRCWYAGVSKEVKISLIYDPNIGKVVQGVTDEARTARAPLTFQCWKCPNGACNGYVHGDNGLCFVCVEAGRKCPPGTVDLKKVQCTVCSHINITCQSVDCIDCMKCGATLAVATNGTITETNVDPQCRVWQTPPIFTVQQYVRFNSDICSTDMKYPASIRANSSFPYYEKFEQQVAAIYLKLDDMIRTVAFSRKHVYGSLTEPYFHPFFLGSNGSAFYELDDGENVYSHWVGLHDSFFMTQYLTGTISTARFKKRAYGFEKALVISKDGYSVLFAFLDSLRCIRALVEAYEQPTETSTVTGTGAAAFPNETQQDYCLRLWRQLVGEFYNICDCDDVDCIIPFYDLHEMLDCLELDNVHDSSPAAAV